MFELFIILVAISIVIAMADWRKGLFACILIALIQDPLRKLAPGESIYLVGLVGIVLISAGLGAMQRRVPLGLGRIAGWDQGLSVPFSLFLLLLFAQAINSFVSFGNPMLTGIGLLSYLAPFAALTLGYQFALHAGARGIEKWLTFYLVVTVAALGTVYLEFSGLDTPMLGQLGEGIKIFDVGTVLSTYSGTFRAPEVAAWHAATAACFAILIFTAGRINYRNITVSIVLVVGLVSIGILTGRRKMLMEIAIFLSFYIFFMAAFRQGATRFSAVALVVGAVAYIYFFNLPEPEQPYPGYAQSEYRLYVQRAASVVEAVPDRFALLGIAPIEWAVQRYGLLGGGLGVGTSGTTQFGGGGAVFGGAGEGGLGKITAELGIPGLILIAWLLISFARHIWRILRFTSWHSPYLSRLSYGLVAFLIANAAVFSVATQIFVDIFVLITLGLTLGFVLAMPILAQQGQGAKLRSSRQLARARGVGGVPGLGSDAGKERADARRSRYRGTGMAVREIEG